MHLGRYGVSPTRTVGVIATLVLLAAVPAAAAPPPTPAPAAPAPAAPAPAAPAAEVTAARYEFNADAVLDASGRGHTLRVVAGHGGRVRPVVHGAGTALAFPSHCAVAICPHVALQTPTSADLNPGRADIAFGADVLLPPGQTSKGQNIVQKGYSKTSSQWKLQVDGVAGRPSCVLVDVRRPRIRMATSTVTVADGRWHAVSCRRAGRILSFFVDGVLQGATAVPASLSVRNSRPMSIGGKGAYLDNDQFNGVLDNVWVRIG